MQCQNCQQENAPRNKFCFNCGVQLDAKPLVEPQSERKQATVLFADIVGSTELIANLDAESASRRLQPAVEAMVQVVRRFGGNGCSLPAPIRHGVRRPYLNIHGAPY
jgi:hypothetical protein